MRAALGLAPSAPLLFAEQPHGNRVEFVRAGRLEGVPWGSVAACDALTANAPGIGLVVRSADCVPIVIAGEAMPGVAVVHAGWRGTLARILEKSIDSLEQSGLNPVELMLWIGPRISGKVYQVSSELAGRFSEEFAGMGYQPDGRFLDLGEINARQAIARGVPRGRIRMSDWCTYSSPDIWPSYRRDGECRGQIYTGAVLLAQGPEEP